MKSQIVTANRLDDGEVVYLAAAGVWSERLADARTAETEAEAEALMAQAMAAVAAARVIGPYPIPVARHGAVLVALGARERIRAAGPTVRTDLGKQAA